MLNKRPIFVNGFQRGGTNILVQFIASHPQMSTLGAEVHEVFYGRNAQPIRKWINRLSGTPVLLATRQHTFWPYRYYERRPLATPIMHYIDLLFYLNKQTARYKHAANGENEKSWREKSEARLVGKCVNGVVLTTPLLAQMYPDATFMGLVRNGLALCEGFVRRGWSASRFGRMYQVICNQMLTDARQCKNYHLIRFEDLLADPAAIVQEVYAQSGLDINDETRFMLQAKKSMSQNGQRTYTFGQQNKTITWHRLDELSSYLRQDVNDNQIARLSEADKNAFLQEAEPAMTALGYLGQRHTDNLRRLVL